MPLLPNCCVQIAWFKEDEKNQGAEYQKVISCHLSSIWQVAATTTGPAFEDVWMEVSEICPVESREKTEEQVKEAEEVKVGWGSKEPLSSAESVGEQNWVGLKHRRASRKEADSCKDMEWGAVGEQEKHGV